MLSNIDWEMEYIVREVINNNVVLESCFDEKYRSFDSHILKNSYHRSRTIINIVNLVGDIFHVSYTVSSFIYNHSIAKEIPVLTKTYQIEISQIEVLYRAMVMVKSRIDQLEITDDEH